MGSCGESKAGRSLISLAWFFCRFQPHLEAISIHKGRPGDVAERSVENGAVALSFFHVHLEAALHTVFALAFMVFQKMQWRWIKGN